MTKNLARALGFSAMLLAAVSAVAQNGPDNDADAAPGYTKSVFDHGPADSINLYNGQLTIPIAVGPSYPVGPKLRFQLTLVYNSRVDDYGNPNQQPVDYVYKPLAGNSALGIGWELTLGAIKSCRQGLTYGNCYFAPDGSQHMFNKVRGNGRVTGDGTQLFLKGSGPFEMWDGDGNHYVFDKQVSGFDDTFAEGYTHDFGRGRDGWYLGSVTDPHGNGYLVTYWTGTYPRWTYGLSSCSAGVTALMQMKAPSGSGGWIPKDITLPSGQSIRVNRGHNGFLDGMITSFDFPVFASGAPAVRTWTLVYDPPYAAYTHFCGPTASLSVNLQRLKELRLPPDLTGSPKYQFLQNDLLTRLTLPTGGTIEYCYGGYTFFHGRASAVVPGCPGIPPPGTTSIAVTPNALFCPGSGIVGEQAPDAVPQCTEDNEARWTDAQMGVLKRTETETVRGRVGTTTYTQYAFPFGEAGTAANPGEPQSLTVVVYPPTDQNASGSIGVRRARATLFLGSPKINAAPAGTTRPTVPGDRVGADIEERVFETDPNMASPPSPACPGTAADAPFCASKAVRALRRTFEYDDAVNLEGNRRLVSEKTIYGAGTCANCPFHQVAFSNSVGDWEGNGRHYDTEAHTGTLGNDTRTTFTDWAPSNWTSGPPAGGSVLPNLFSERRVTEGASVRDELFDFDAADGFLKGSLVYDAARDLAFLHCRYDDGAGNVDKEYRKTFSSGSPPTPPYCPNSFPNVGTDGDAFGKDYTWQNGELLSARWINGSPGTPTFSTRSYTRDTTTGWVKTSSDSAGRTTSYLYDGLGRVTRIDPPVATELKTFVCYEGPNATTAYRASSAQACPVAFTNASAKTWEHYDYDGLGRGIRQKRRLPGAQVSKHFSLFDAAGNSHFSSEWVADATSEGVSAALPTACIFSNGSFATARPASAPGSYRMCYDPFGRPQQTIGSKHSSLRTMDRKDGAAWYSDTFESAQTYCVNGTFTNLQAASCSAGGFHTVASARKDAFGRLTAATEASGETTSYQYDVSAKLTRVTQGIQTRVFEYDANGFLRKQTTPEEGVMTYDAIGSLGNVRQETRPGALLVARKFDFAGRLTQQDAGGLKFQVNCYDGTGACVDGSPNSFGGAYPGGKLTRRYGYNYVPTAGPTVDESFEYGDGAGRLTRVTTATGNGDLSASVSQTWSYDTLGLPFLHGHPRSSGAPAFSVATSFADALPISISASGQQVVTAAGYNLAAGLASWTAGNSGAPVVTTIAADPSLLPRPASIANNLWSSGTYTYDSEGNILKTGSDLYGYDSRSRLISAKLGSSQRNFAYDAYGNLTSAQIDPATNRIKLSDPGAPSYDARGNLTAYSGDTMSFDALDRQYRNASGTADWLYLFSGAAERVVKFPAKAAVLRREMARYVAEANVIAKGWTLPACAAVFSDVACTDPDALYVQLVAEKGITVGCGGGLYCPDATLTRAQMAVFVVKGYKPDGFTPPACRGTFTDVTCSGPYASFAPWIEQLYRDGVTAGCGTNPLRFCPGNTVGEWEMLVWLAKAPGAIPGSSFWSGYRPVPRGSIYTWRDPQNRVVTEGAGGATGAATAALSIARDNVFLGNLLVASYVASPAGWQYTASDHLGSPRAVFNQSAQLVEARKHWPYGEDTNATPPAQRLSFCLMERDTESTRFHDHARNHDYVLGRFLSPDRAGGSPANPQSWNRYAYTLGNPMKYLDPSGDVAVGFTGLQFPPWKAPRDGGIQSIGRYLSQLKGIGPVRVLTHWSTAAALDFVVSEYRKDPTKPVVLFGHSRGASAAISTAQRLKALGIPVDLLITIDPVMIDPSLQQAVPSNVRKVANFYERESPLISSYLTGEASTDVENRELPSLNDPHSSADDWVVYSNELVRLVSGLLEEARKREKGERLPCSKGDSTCRTDR
ncbi:MAG: RHS repeat-associated core domain-containing protein [Thermoanaerobaculia bacterium]